MENGFFNPSASERRTLPQIPPIDHAATNVLPNPSISPAAPSQPPVALNRSRQPLHLGML